MTVNPSCTTLCNRVREYIRYHLMLQTLHILLLYRPARSPRYSPFPATNYPLYRYIVAEQLVIRAVRIRDPVEVFVI